MNTPTTHSWKATRYGMSCPISTADLLAKIDDGAEQVSETVFLWRGWTIVKVAPAPHPDAR